MRKYESANLQRVKNEYTYLMTLFRKATIHDAPLINTLVNSAYRGDSSKKGWTTEADLLGGQRTDEEVLTNMILDENGHIELLIEDDEILGCVYLHKGSEALYLGMLTINPTLQASGHGKKILTRSEELAQEWEFKEIKMTVISARTELIAYYERRGYFKTGKTEPFPDNDPRFGIPKVKLVFIEMKKRI